MPQQLCGGHVATRVAGTRRLQPGLRSPRGWMNADVDALHPACLDPDGPPTLLGSRPAVNPRSARRTEMSVDPNRRLTGHEAPIDRMTCSQSDSRYPQCEPDAAGIAGREPICRSTNSGGSRSIARPPRLPGRSGNTPRFGGGRYQQTVSGSLGTP